MPEGLAAVVITGEPLKLSRGSRLFYFFFCVVWGGRGFSGVGGTWFCQWHGPCPCVTPLPPQANRLPVSLAVAVRQKEKQMPVSLGLSQSRSYIRPRLKVDSLSASKLVCT